MARPSEALLEEAGEWIAEQMMEEGMLMTSAFVDLVLSMEWDAIDGGADADDRAKVVDEIARRMQEEEVRVGPPPETISTDGIDTSQITPVPRSMIELVLSWEDDFLGFAGIKRGG